MMFFEIMLLHRRIKKLACLWQLVSAVTPPLTDNQTLVRLDTIRYLWDAWCSILCLYDLLWSCCIFWIWSASYCSLGLGPNFSFDIDALTFYLSGTFSRLEQELDARSCKEKGLVKTVLTFNTAASRRLQLSALTCLQLQRVWHWQNPRSKILNPIMTLSQPAKDLRILEGTLFLQPSMCETWDNKHKWINRWEKKQHETPVYRFSLALDLCCAILWFV